MRTLFYTAIALWLFAYCNPLMAQNPLRIGLADHGKEFRVKTGQIFQVVFELECVGCAQVWTEQHPSLSNVRLISNQTKDRSCIQCTGGTVTRVFTYKAIKKGTIKMQFRYFNQSLGIKVSVQ